MIACQVVPQTRTQIANSCQVLSRCIGARLQSKAKLARPCMPRRRRAVDALDDHRVHAEGEGAVEARVGAVLGEHVADRVAGTPVAGSTSGIEQRPHGLTSFSRTGPSAAVEDDLVEMVLAVRVEAAEHEVGPEARHRHRRLAGAARDAGSPRRATRLEATSSGKPSWNGVLGLERRRSSARSARRRASGSKRARRSGRPRKSLNHCAHSAPMS